MIVIVWLAESVHFALPALQAISNPNPNSLAKSDSSIPLPYFYSLSNNTVDIQKWITKDYELILVWTDI